MATKRLTEATLRRIVREETRKLTEAPMGPPWGRGPGVAGEWHTVDNFPYVIAETDNMQLERAWNAWVTATVNLTDFADIQLADLEDGGRPVDVKDMAENFMRFTILSE